MTYTDTVIQAEKYALLYGHTTGDMYAILTSTGVGQIEGDSDAED